MIKKEIFNLIEKFAKILQIQLNMEYTYKNKNVATAFKGIGSFGELLIGLYNPNYVGSGSGGLGMDLIDKKNAKEIEVKTAVTFQPNKCKNKNCSFKFSNLFNSCVICNSKDFKSISDSRFSINAKKLLEHLGSKNFEKISCVHIYQKTESHNFELGEISFYIDCYDINFSNESKEILNKKIIYFQNQHNLSNKSDTCNLIPKSFDFFMLNPIWFDAFEFKINYKNIEKNISVKRTFSENNSKLKVPLSVCVKKEEKEIFENLKSFDKSTNSAEVTDFVLNMQYRNKSYNKKRGEIRNVFNLNKKKNHI